MLWQPTRGILQPNQQWRRPQTASGASYVGPGDVVASADCWYGLRAYTSASIGANAVKLRRDSDDTTQDFATISGGGLDLSAISTFASGANLFVDTLYDQAGTARLDYSGGVLANQPQFILNGIGSLPVLRGNGTSTALSNRPAFFPGSLLTAPVTISSVTKNSATTNLQGILGMGGIVQYDDTSGNIGLFGGSFVSVTGTVGTRSIQAIFNGASWCHANGTDSSTVNAGTSSTDVNRAIFAAFGGHGSGDWMEAGGWTSAFGATPAGDMTTNQRNYWGF